MSVARTILSFVDSCLRELVSDEKFTVGLVFFIEEMDEASEEKFTVGLGQNWSDPRIFFLLGLNTSYSITFTFRLILLGKGWTILYL